MAREKISKDKKIQLVLQYINKEKSAKEIATNNDITEGQLRDWARKYKIHGDNALDDKRGIRKDQSDLSQEEILKRKNKELEEKNRRLEAELLLIKKLKELEGGVI
ncbi:helix-turn-helix domain-containing protein [Fusobacterium mortiferum]|nr:helix-turn-helix domain-containing protein [Fusobacterium mortiferum]MBM6876256.1 helix-turn-helix domain-containing protein [Fusobacterium mortiferum]